MYLKCYDYQLLTSRMLALMKRRAKFKLFLLRKAANIWILNPRWHEPITNNTTLNRSPVTIPTLKQRCLLHHQGRCHRVIISCHHRYKTLNTAVISSAVAKYWQKHWHLSLLNMSTVLMFYQHQHRDTGDYCLKILRVLCAFISVCFSCKMGNGQDS